MNIKLLTPENWKDYQLLDSGNGEKLERFGKYVIARPEPQAIWNKSKTDKEWGSIADAYFRNDRSGEDRGEWECKKSMPQSWHIEYSYKGMNLRMRLGLTSFKHVGIFPEQAANWNYIYDNLTEIGKNTGAPPKLLNLFAYTGGSTLAARAAGAEATHVDSVKQVVTWARENMEASGMDSVRWIIEDALKFARREVKRGKKYNGIVLDPPAYGRGTDGERWIIDENLNEMLSLCCELLEPRNSFIVLNLYSKGMSALLARTAVQNLTGQFDREEFGELYFADPFDKALPLGVYYRCRR